ncbi:MAG: MetQ/NlpA family ABC transporter substrate-binding protein, partial [Desulfovibrionaceae bacterium]|nr:MetQ/NlpA family ABC transporter substrate-binding protein [Desulfovibrionaceae bacterium]
MRIRSLLLAALVAAGLLAGTAATSQAAKTLRVGASPTPHAEILRAAEPMLKEKGVNLEIIEYADYVQP